MYLEKMNNGLEDIEIYEKHCQIRTDVSYKTLLECLKQLRTEENKMDWRDADEKWLSPFDMWVINAIDYYSGTLNPTVNSALKDALQKLSIWLRTIKANMSSKKLVFQC